jgi:hypothetical protein
VHDEYLDGEPKGWGPVASLRPRTELEQKELQRSLATLLESRLVGSARIGAALNRPPESLTRDDVALWLMCERWAHASRFCGENCAYGLLTTELRRLPDHACWAVHEATVDRWKERHGTREGTLLHPPAWPIEWPQGQALMLCVERCTPVGTVTLFGLVRQASNRPSLPVSDGEAASAYTHPWQWIEPVIVTEPADPSAALGSVTQELKKWYMARLFGRPTRPGPKLGSTHREPSDREKEAYAIACRELQPKDRRPTPIAIRMGTILSSEVPVDPKWVSYWQGKGKLPRDPKAPRRNRKNRVIE